MDSSIQKHLTRALKIMKPAEMLMDSIRLKSILKDLCPRLNKEICIVISFFTNHLVQEMIQAGKQISELEFMKLAERFATLTGYDRKTAEWCVLIWARSLEKKLDFTYKNLKYPPPEIKKFDPVDDTVVHGKEVQISWQVENAIKVFFIFQDKEIEVKETGNIKVLIKNDEPISLMAVGFFEYRAIATKEIKVINNVNIIDFKSDAEMIIAGNPVKLFWNIEHATEVTLSNSNVVYKGVDEAIVYPLFSTSYTLTATNNTGSKKAVKGIQVIQKPTFDNDRFLKLPLLKGVTLKQRTILVTPSIRHKHIKLNFPDNKAHYSLFKCTRKRFTVGFLKIVKEKAKKIFL